MGLRTLYSLLLAGCLFFITGTPAVCAGHSLMHYSARPDGNTYSGTVLDSETGEPLIGAAVILKGAKDVAAITDVDGRFEITVESGKEDRIVFEVSYLGYVTTEFSPSGTANLKFLLSPDMNELDEVQVVAYGAQRKVSVTGAITAVNGEQLLKSPSGSAAGSLAGAVSGITTVQASGQPGAEDPVIYVRGTGSLSDAASRPLILVDGVERSFFQMDPHEIESITVLKDASSTAVFGVRGANGVILVTTKRGETGRAKISLTSSFGLTQSLRNLRQVGSYEHASIYSAAQRSDRPDIQDSELTFSPYITELFRTNSDPLMFPSTDWSDYLFKNLAWQTQHNITVSGGMDRVRYFVSLGYLHQDGMLKRLDLNYNPNYLYDRYNYRVNVDVDITSSTVLTLNIGGRVGKRNSPKNDDIWKKLMWCTPYSSPGLVDGMYIFEPNKEYLSIGSGTSGLDLFYNWGYDQNTDNVLNIDLSLNQKLDFITKGLSLNVKGAYNSNYNVYVSRGPTSGNPKVTPFYKGYFTQPGMAIDNPMFDTSIVYRVANRQMDEPLSYSYSSGRGRDWYLEASLNWSRQFGNHEVTALLLYNQSKTYYPSQFIEIPSSYLGYVGRVTYNWKRRYMIDLNVGYNGSENFAPGKRWGDFWSVGAAWLINKEAFFHAPWVDELKLKFSIGQQGNDNIGERTMAMRGFAFTDMYNLVAASDSQMSATFWRIGNPEITWETATNLNIGLEFSLFSGRLSGSLDYYNEVGDEGYLEAPIGTGPYMLTEAITGEKIVLTAFEDYWRGTPAIDEVTIAIVPNVSTQIIGLENGDYDAVRNPPIDACTHLDGNPDISWDYTDSTGRITLYLAAWGGRIGEDLNFRRAIQCGIDKQEVSIATSNGYATILDIDMCPMYGGYPEEGIVTVDYDPEQAREYLEASGYAGENFDILVKSGTGEEAAAKVIQSQLIELGISCSVTAVDNTTYSELQYSGTFDSIIREQLSSMVDADGASTYFNTTPGYAYTKNCKYPLAETIYPLFVKGREVQGDEREPYYVEACNLITEEAYLVPLYNGLIAVACSSGLRGVEAHCLGTYNFYHWSWA